MSKQACTISWMVPVLDLSSDSRRTARNPAQVTGATHTGRLVTGLWSCLRPKGTNHPHRDFQAHQTNRQIDKLTDKADL